MTSSIVLHIVLSLFRLQRYENKMKIIVAGRAFFSFLFVNLQAKQINIMNENFAIQLFEGRKVRFMWDEEAEKYYFAIVDIVQVLTESLDATAYWRKLKQRLKAEGNETVTNCHALKMPAADGKRRLTDVADLEQTFRLIQSIPSKKAEPVKAWLAEVGAQRIDQDTA